MTDSVYKVIELVGVSSESWERAAANAVETAAKSLRDLRIAQTWSFNPARGRSPTSRKSSRNSSTGAASRR